MSKMINLTRAAKILGRSRTYIARVLLAPGLIDGAYKSQPEHGGRPMWLMPLDSIMKYKDSVTPAPRKITRATAPAPSPSPESPEVTIRIRIIIETINGGAV